MSETKVESRLAKIVHVVAPGFANGPLEVVINHGSHQGVKPGDLFIVFGIGPHIIDPDTGQDLGALEILRGRGEVVHVQEHLATIRTAERRRIRPAKRITREPSWAAGVGLSRMLGGSGVVMEEELSPEAEIPFDSVQLGDFAKPI